MANPGTVLSYLLSLSLSNISCLEVRLARQRVEMGSTKVLHGSLPTPRARLRNFSTLLDSAGCLVALGSTIQCICSNIFRAPESSTRIYTFLCLNCQKSVQLSSSCCWRCDCFRQRDPWSREKIQFKKEVTVVISA